MVRRSKSLSHDLYKSVYLSHDFGQSLFDLLRAARLIRQLTQQQLAHKLGLRQRQISDLERAAMDPRLSTIQNVARALDLELMLIPRHLISAVEGLQRPGNASTTRPLYALGDDDAESGPDERPRVEIGSTGDQGGPTPQPSPPKVTR